MHKKILVTLGLTLLLFIALAGCTSTSTPSSTPTPTPTSSTPAPTPSSFTSTPAPAQTTTLQPVEVVSMSGPLPFTIVEITLKNVSAEPVVSLNVALELSGIPARTFIFDFGVSSARPLLPGKSAIARSTLPKGGFSDSVSYPLNISGSLQGNATFTYTTQVQITAPSGSPAASSTSISISPSTGAYLTNSENVSSEVLLVDARINEGLSDKKYIAPWYPAGIVNAGEPVLIVSGSIRNKHEQNKEIAMYAEGFDAAGKQVAWTLDTAHIVGQIGLHLEKNEIGQFTLHLNMAENIRSIRILANNYSITPP
jgi:hypothetical protein